MNLREVSIAVISHAGIRQINRAVYRELKKSVGALYLIIPSAIALRSGVVLTHEPAAPQDPDLVPLELQGINPRTYYYPALLTFLEENQPDIILLENDPVSRLGLMLSSWSRRKGKKIICQSYENIRRDTRSTLMQLGWKALPKNIVLNWLYQYMAEKVDAVLVVNKESERLFEQYAYRSIVRIPLGYDPHVFFQDTTLKEQFRNQLHIHSETVLVAYFGRMVPQKGVHLLIHALKELKTLNWTLLLDHAFDQQDTYTSYIRSLIQEYGFTDRVVYFEANHVEIANYMRAADIMVAPSVTTRDFKEQYGRAVQEAMACGCVCLVSDSGHLQDLVGDPSLIFRENQVATLRDSLMHWISNHKERERYGAWLSERASGTLTTLKQAASLEQVFHNLISAAS